jgi:uncharacterized repeat protein (TIGR03803 family)
MAASSFIFRPGAARGCGKGRPHRPPGPAALRLAVYGLAAVLAGTAQASGHLPASQASSYTVVAAPTPAQGDHLTAPLTRGPDGLMYTVASAGGAGGRGSVLRIENDGSVTVVHAFAADGSEGKSPQQGLLLAADGWLYGSTFYGGGQTLGTLFKVSTDGQFAVVHTFKNDIGGGFGHPTCPLVQDAEGNFYGSLNDYGTAVFKMTPDYKVSILRKLPFKQGHSTGVSSLVLAPDGLLYGATRYAYVNDGGAIFSIDPGSGRFRLLHTFACATDGCVAGNSLAAGPDHAIYGTTISEGPANGGAAWRISDKGEFSVIHVFAGNDPLGFNPEGGFIRDEAGKLYGTNASGGTAGGGGTVYSMTRKGVGTLLHAFPYEQTSDGYRPNTATLAPDGRVYGTTQFGGPYAPGGVVYRIELSQ